MNRTELQCDACGNNIQISLFQPSWLDMDILGKSPSCMYTNNYKLNDLLTINHLLGEQNQILKQQICSLMKSLNYFIEESNKESNAPI